MFLAAAAITVVVVVVAGAVTAPHLGDSFVPPFKEGDILIRWDGPPGTSREEMNRIAALAGAELRSIPGVRGVGGHTGRAITSDQVVGTNAGEIWVNIDPSADHDATLAAIRDTVAGYPGLSHAVSTYTSDRTTDVLGGDPNDVAIRVYGQEDAILRQKADEVAQALTGIDGLVDLTVVAPIEEPRLKIAVDLERAGARGVAPGDVRRAAATQVAGIEVGFLFEEQKIFEVVVWGSPEARHSIDSVRNVIVPTMRRRGPTRRRRRRQHQQRPFSDPARGRVPVHRCRGRCPRARLRLSHDGRQQPSRGSRIPLGVPRRGPRRTRSRPRRTCPA